MRSSLRGFRSLSRSRVDRVNAFCLLRHQSCNFAFKTSAITRTIADNSAEMLAIECDLIPMISISIVIVP